MASSWAPGLQERIQQKRLLSFINHSVDFVRSYIPFVSSPTSKVADVNMLPPWTAKVLLDFFSNTKETGDATSDVPSLYLAYKSRMR